jgi:hypothetical protein
LTGAELLQELDRLRAENSRLKSTPRTNGITLKVSEKGACSVYGMGRFPVTLYASQWETLLSKVDEIKAFLAANHDKLAHKA